MKATNIILTFYTVLSLAPVFAQGSLTPPAGPPGPVMKSLEQVEPRVLIRNDFENLQRVVISASGSYYLGEDVLAFGDSHGIEITASNVTLDLNGFTIQGNLEVGSLDGVRIGEGANNVTIRNGTVRLFLGIGINAPAYGEGYDATTPTNLRVSDVRLISNALGGLRMGSRGVVTDSIAQGNSGTGFFTTYNSIIRDCIATGNTGHGIEFWGSCQVTGNSCSDNTQNGILANGSSSVITENLVTGSTLNGIYVSGVGLRGNRVDSNVSNYNQQYGIKVEGTDNLVTRNLSLGNSQGHYNIDPNNSAGPVVTAPTGPWDNLQ